MSFWKDKVVIITGSRMGIGKALAIAIGSKGGRVFLNARNEEKLISTQKELESMNIDCGSMAGDVSQYSDCQEMVNECLRKFGRVDVLINNAGLASQTNLEDIEPEVFQSIINVNLTGSVFMTKAVLPEIKRTQGSILFIGSVAGVQGIGGYSAYSSSKQALKAISQSLRIELQEENVHIGLAYVGFTENDAQKQFLDAKGNRVNLPSRDNVKQMPVVEVAQNIMKMIENRKKQSVFGLMGKLTYHLDRFFPFMIRMILKRAYKK